MADSTHLSQPLDVARLCRHDAKLAGDCGANALPRLQDRLLKGDAKIRYQLAFGQTPDKQQWLNIHLQAQLSLQCERTLQPFDWPLDAQNRVLLLPELVLANMPDELPEAADIISVPEEGLSIIELIEEELLLSLPLVPQSDQPLAYTAPDEQPVSKPNPFAALAALRS